MANQFHAPDSGLSGCCFRDVKQENFLINLRDRTTYSAKVWDMLSHSFSPWEQRVLEVKGSLTIGNNTHQQHWKYGSSLLLWPKKWFICISCPVWKHWSHHKAPGNESSKLSFELGSKEGFKAREQQQARENREARKQLLLLSIKLSGRATAAPAPAILVYLDISSCQSTEDIISLAVSAWTANSAAQHMYS